MKILHRYILTQLIQNVILCAIMFTFLFLFVDFFDRIDNVSDGKLWDIVFYFIYKLPHMFNITLPISMLVATLFTIGIMTKNSELTAMRASGATLFWLSKPVFFVGLIVSVFSFAVSEWIIPYTQQKSKEIYSLDIKGRGESGELSREAFWFRDNEKFYSVGLFDSRNDSLLDVSVFEVLPDSNIKERVDAVEAKWIGKSLGWGMSQVRDSIFITEKGERNDPHSREVYDSLPLVISQEPARFYRSKTDPHTMSFRDLKVFIDEQDNNGLSTKSYLADLYAKLSFPFINILLPLIVVPFVVGSGRTKSLAGAGLAAVITGFSYHVVHSLSIALARAELWPPMISAWAANMLLAAVGIILFFGAEAPE